MNILKAIKRNIKLKGFQNKNHAALECLRECGFFLPEIRKGLMVLNGITLGDLTGNTISNAGASNTIKGLRRNPVVMSGLAEKLGIDVGVLFPEE